MDSDKAEQHDNHVQRDDGHEQDDENLQSGRDERQEHPCAVKQDARARRERDEADDGSNHVTIATGNARSAAGIVRSSHARRLPWISPLG